MIGGGEVRIVKELVEKPEVESITVCEVDEVGSVIFDFTLPKIIIDKNKQHS